MKKQTILLVILVLGLALFAQDIQQEAISINIEVPVRVYKGDKFVDNLTVKDFEVYEDGILQEIEAVYLINKMNIQSKEEKQTFKPDTSRSFYLLFDVVEYSPKLNKALDYFFQNVLDPQDNLTIVTPIKTYNLKSDALSKVSAEEAINQTREILRKDAWIGNSEYRSLNNDLKNLIRSRSATGSSSRGRTDTFRGGAGRGVTIATSSDAPENDPVVNLVKYEEILSRLESVRNVDQKRLLDFADILKDQQGQKYVFLFYQREFIPQFENVDYFSQLNKNDVNLTMNLTALMGYYFRNIAVDMDSIKQAYADSSISINFLFFTKPAKNIPGVRMVEHSEDVFSIFREMAQATGGITTSSSNPKYLFERASDAVESYYLLYYSPKNYQTDGKFKKIKVNVKGKNYRVTHRSGYIAD